MNNFPPASECSPEDIDAIADLVVSDSSASWDLAGSREHIEALCRRYQALVQVRADLIERDQRHEQARERLGKLASEAIDQGESANQTIAALERALAAATNDLDAARTEIRALTSMLDAERNARQAEVLAAEADRERADAAEAAAEVFEAAGRAALAILARDRGTKPTDPVPLAELARAADGRLSRALVRELQTSALLRVQLERACRRLEEIQQTDAANDRIRSAFASAVPAITGVTVEDLDRQLDAELAAHPEPGPLHHARDQRDHQEDTTP